jgi:hypothetical protein
MKPDRFPTLLAGRRPAPNSHIPVLKQRRLSPPSG